MGWAWPFGVPCFVKEEDWVPAWDENVQIDPDDDVGVKSLNDVVAVKSEPLEDEQFLSDWMESHHSSLRSGATEKAVEYGSLDLQIMGAVLAVWPGIPEDATPTMQMQAAIAFYNLGKLARVLSALGEGKPAPTDSWKDAEVYAMMGLYVQEHGQWP